MHEGGSPNTVNLSSQLLSSLSCLFSVGRNFSEIFMCCALVGSSTVAFSLVLVVSSYLI